MIREQAPRHVSMLTTNAELKLKGFTEKQESSRTNTKEMPFSSVQFGSVAQSCGSLPMDRVASASSPTPSFSQAPVALTQ